MAVRKAREQPFVAGLTTAAGEYNRLVERHQPRRWFDADYCRWLRAARITLIEEFGFRHRAIIVHVWSRRAEVTCLAWPREQLSLELASRAT